MLNTDTGANTGAETGPRPPVTDTDRLINPQSHTGQEIEKRGRGRPKGSTGKGRPAGSKNKTTLLKAAIADDFTRLARKESRAVFQKLAEMAKGGDQAMIKLFMDKVLANAAPEGVVTKGDFGINIVISDMRPEEKVLEGEIIDADVSE